MAKQVAMPQQQQGDNGLGKVLTLGGAAVGGAFGGPAGAVQGAGVGSTAGSLLQPAPQQQVAPVQAGGDAMSRRMQGDDTLNQLREAQKALATLPPEQQQQYGAPINQAYAMEARKRGMT